MEAVEFVGIFRMEDVPALPYLKVEFRLLRFPRGVSTMEPWELLREEHKSIRQAVRVLNTMTEQLEQGVPVDRHDVNALLIFLHYFADACHQAKEESILFPALKSSEKYHNYQNDLEALLEEHSEDRSLIEGTQALLFTDRQSEFNASARKLSSLLSEHAKKEEDILLPLAQQIMSSKTAQEVAMRMQEADAKFGYRQRQLLLDMLQYLQEKYTRKAA
jgi:hemerythrin-like domain-containing protein